MRIRLLPLLIFCITVMFGIKAGSFMKESAALASMLQAEAFAAQEPAAGEEEQEKEGGDGDEEANPPSMEEESDSHGEGNAEKAEEKPSATSKVTTERPEDVTEREFSPVEVDLLTSLSKRREQLNQREQDMLLRENVLKATELRLEKQMQEIQVVQEEVEKLLAEYKKHDDAKIKGLVKIYESMKPKDAAKIFEEMEIPLLMEVVDKMSERKVAPVLASMSPIKAKQVTTELAAFRRLKIPEPVPEPVLPPAAEKKPEAPVAPAADAAPTTIPEATSGATPNGEDAAKAESAAGQN